MTAVALALCRSLSALLRRSSLSAYSDYSPAELSSQIITSMAESQKLTCCCGCNCLLSKWAIRAHIKAFLAKQRQENSSGNGDPPLHAPSFEFNPSLLLLNPPAAFDSLQSPEDAHTEASGHFVDDALLDHLIRTSQTTDDSDNDSEDSEDALEGDAVEAADTIDSETNDFTDGEGVDTEGNVDLREGIDSDSDWDALAGELIVEEELGKFGHSLLHIP